MSAADESVASSPPRRTPLPARLSVGEIEPAALDDDDVALRRRLQWMIGGRLVVATLLLGGTLVVGVSTWSALSSFTPQLLLLLIAGTFAASLVFAVWLPRARWLRGFAAVQIAWDVALTTGIVYLVGGVASAFTFLYGIEILMAAIVVGPHAARVTAVWSVLAYITVGLTTANGWLPYPPDQPSTTYLLQAPEVSLSVLRNIVGLALVGVLAGNLSMRLHRTGGELRRAAASAASLAKINEYILRSITTGIVTTDHEGRVRTLNPAASELLRADEAALVGRPVRDLLPMDATSTAAPGPIRAEGTATRADDTTFSVGFTKTSLVDAEGVAIGQLVAFQDLTEVEQLRDAAEREKRLAALGRLAAGLAHEIRNPLSSISGSVQLVRESTRLDEEDKRLLGIVISEVDRLEDLVGTILELGRPSEPQRSMIDLARLAQDVVSVAKRGVSAASHVEIGVTAEPTPAVQAWIDPAQVRQVVWNLLKNALQASPHGGRVTIVVRGGEGGSATLEVSDEGPGIDPNERSRVFEMFHSGRPQGVGLGLALVKQIVAAHDGTIDVVSERVRGATFRVTFPRRSA